MQFNIEASRDRPEELFSTRQSVVKIAEKMVRRWYGARKFRSIYQNSHSEYHNKPFKRNFISGESRDGGGAGGRGKRSRMPRKRIWAPRKVKPIIQTFVASKLRKKCSRPGVDAPEYPR